MLELWRAAEYREERYAAIVVARRYHRFHTLRIEPNLADREFFIRKAIGWALRDYAWTDPDEVERYVARARGRAEPAQSPRSPEEPR